MLLHLSCPAILLAIAIGLSLVATVIQSSPNPSATEMLVDKLFKSYNRNVRPGGFHRNTTIINIGLAPVYVQDLDEEKSLFILDARIQMDWIDNRLSWNKTDYMGIGVIRISNSFPWLPDITVYNSPSKHADPKTNSNVLIYSTGKVLWISPSHIVSYCPVKKAGEYPVDSQTCSVTLGSWTYDRWLVDLVVKEDDYDLESFLNKNPRWELILDKSRMVKFAKQYSCCKEPYVTVVAQFRLRRRAVADLELVKAPCTIALVLTLLIFWMSYRSGQKVIVGSFLLFMLTVLLLYVANTTKFAEAKQVAVSLIRSSMYVITSAVVFEVLLSNIIQCLKRCKPPPFLTKLLTCQPRAFFVSLLPKKGKNSAEQQPEDRTLSNSHVESVDGVDPKQETVEQFQHWNTVVFVMEKVVFIIFVIVVASLVV